MAGYTTRADNGEIVFAPEELACFVLEADQTVTNSDTLVTVPAFTVPVGKYERYILRYNIFLSTTATGDFKYLVDAPASPTLFRQVSWSQGGAATTIVAGGSTGGAVATAEGALTVVGTGAEGFLLANLLVVNGANSGNIIFQFAQNTATSAESAIVRAGSFLEVRKF
jgi:hypothetical protein